MRDDDGKYYNNYIYKSKKLDILRVLNNLDKSIDPFDITGKKHPELKDLLTFSSMFTPTFDPSEERVYRAILEQAYRDGQVDKDFLDRLTGPMNPFVNSRPKRNKKF